MKRTLTVLLAVIAVVAGMVGGFAYASSSDAPAVAACTPAPPVVPGPNGVQVTVTCDVPTPAPVTETATVTATATATATVTATTTATTTITATPTPTVTPTPTPTVTPTPNPGGFPNASNTGVPAGTTLHACASTITAAGTYDSCTFTGGVSIRAANVVITRSLIRGQVTAPNDDLRGAVFRDTEINCGCLSTSANSTPTAIQYDNFTLLRVNLHDSGHGVAMGSNVTIQDSWIHNLGGNTDAHKDGIYVGDGHDSVIKHNNIVCNDGPKAGCTSAIGLLTDFGPITRFTIDGNLLNTIGSYCFYGAGGPQKPYHSDHITFTNNVFGKDLYAKCGFYGPVTYFDSSPALGNVWSGNTFIDGASVPPSN